MALLVSCSSVKQKYQEVSLGFYSYNTSSAILQHCRVGHLSHHCGSKHPLPPRKHWGPECLNKKENDVSVRDHFPANKERPMDAQAGLSTWCDVESAYNTLHAASTELFPESFNWAALLVSFLLLRLRKEGKCKLREKGFKQITITDHSLSHQETHRGRNSKQLVILTVKGREKNEDMHASLCSAPLCT